MNTSKVSFFVNPPRDVAIYFSFRNFSRMCSCRWRERGGERQRERESGLNTDAGTHEII
jgi:hypothetical protein